MYLLGFDIGGTKCAVITAQWADGNIHILKKEKCETDFSVSPKQMIFRLIALAEGILEGAPDAIGISCGGPLDLDQGIIQGPPNLPGWNDVHIVEMISGHFGVPVHLQNDANACAVAEWKFGAGRGTDNMIFLTFGTGLGAGLILNGKLYTGTNGNAGEVGHIRLAPDGPVGFGKAGSFEGFCSGGGLAQLGGASALELAERANQGDKESLAVWQRCGEKLGMGLSILIDILNPEKIVIGSIYARQEKRLWEHAQKVIDTEALEISAACCQVVPAALGEQIGDYAAIATALL